MKTLSWFIMVLMILSYSGDLYAFQLDNKIIDSNSVIQKRIRDQLKLVKKKKARQIKRIVTADSTIIYGADKNLTHIMHVSSYNKFTGNHVQFTYNESGVIWIGVLRASKKVNGKENKRRKSIYYFDKGDLIYSKDRNAEDDIAFLLFEADRYLRQGTRVLATPY